MAPRCWRWRSLQEHVLALPDDVVVHPTHGAGSFCSAPAGGDRVTTIGRERAASPLLASPDEDAFVQRLLAGYGSYPPTSCDSGSGTGEVLRSSAPRFPTCPR